MPGRERRETSGLTGHVKAVIGAACSDDIICFSMVYVENIAAHYVKALILLLMELGLNNRGRDGGKKNEAESDPDAASLS
ncbi:hypothetical protein [Paenibacillus sp. GCM10023250]|uniref:hypothetical protein n=1 Tax=Paenibacillus sp. GCM10023250 TaxID=3252648 RepID=UPI00361E8AE3